MQGPSKEPGPRAGTVTHNTEEVCGIVSQDFGDKVKRLIQVLVDMEDKEKGGLERSNMESIRGFLVYMARTYRDMNPYLKGLHLTLYSWRPSRDKDAWIIQVEQVMLADMDGKWEKV